MENISSKREVELKEDKQSVTHLKYEDYSGSYNRTGFRVVIGVVVPLFVIGFVAGAFILVAVHNGTLLFVLMGLFVAVVGILVWNAWRGSSAGIAFLLGYSDSELERATDGQYVKVTGVVSCGSAPLESSYEKISRCIYTSTGLYEYRGWKVNSVNPKHRQFSWELTYLERYVTDFYISDLQSGTRVLVKAGNGAKVTPYIDETTIINIVQKKTELSFDLINWLRERNLSSDDRLMRLKEGYVKEGSTISVMGVVRHIDNVVTIVPPSEPISTGCQWLKFFLPASIEGIVLRYEEALIQNVEPV
ncbi:hypothetical protein SUGI_0464430 [Cryptomeria japonica]|uniref:uncharacterized membrane protein At1g16860 n=1 Tax=Cryptomeria japonica TaxID=3369 RepID=UPI002408D269|nr:uncharacterized membrane protein At1g16860 [Cryptomeria japonica]GLJ24332.1 hypothetical protein SUGI_0464430 [Cryptomeria japonica]